MGVRSVFHCGARCSVTATVPIKTQSIIWTEMIYPTPVCVCERERAYNNSYKSTVKAYVVTPVIYRHWAEASLVLLIYLLLSRCSWLCCFCTSSPASDAPMKPCHKTTIVSVLSADWASVWLWFTSNRFYKYRKRNILGAIGLPRRHFICQQTL